MKKNNLKQQTEEMKAKVKRLGPVKIIILLIMLVGTICSYVFHDYIFASDSIFNRGISTSEFLNSLLALVPNIVRAIQVITIILVATSIIIGIINRLFTKTQREITVVKLTSSIIKWVAAIILVIAVLAIWGVDTTALITGAGVLTLIVGLGMQSLISDIVAGLFIVFENEFNVGDIITVDGFRGTVVSLGIRTTQLEAVGTVKIFNNSEIRGVLNQTVQPSKAKTLIDIEYGDSLARVEEIIKNKLPEIKIEGVIGEIVYDGVAALGASGVTLQFTADCDENDIFAVQRAMNGRLKVMFDENGIGIPFNQLVVHMNKK